MTDEMGGNTSAELKRRADRRVEILDEMAELSEQLKGYKAEDKNDGFTEQAIAKIIKELRAGADQVVANLTLEAEVNTYRRAVGIPTDLATAQEKAREEADAVPEPKPKRKRRSDDDDQHPGGE